MRPAPRLVIANRGEIARRVLRSARARGFRVAVISTPADRGAPVRAEADHVLHVEDFLDGGAVVEAASGWGADLLHPGYGFLSENPDFAAAVERAGIAFCGPTAESMRRLGDKQAARRLALASGVPVIPGTDADALDLGTDPTDALDLGTDPADVLTRLGIGLPCAVKASAGGGGIGIRVVEDAAELPEALARASAQARAAFGDGTVYLERWLHRARHIEVQVFGDGVGEGIHLGERECSAQRRRQKLLEWTPAFGMTPSLRCRLGEAALKLVAASRYRGAGTVEFLVEPDGRFHFLEVNTRLQVEHPVTEAVYGVDLVGAQFDLALGTWPETLPPPAAPTAFEPLAPRGAAIEARVIAESPREGFAPSPGRIRRYRPPEGIRVDSGVEAGSPVPAGFDSLLFKAIAPGADLSRTASRLARALEASVVHGVETNLSLLVATLRHPDFLAGRIHTGWVEERLAELVRDPFPDWATARLLAPRVAEAVITAASGRRSDPAAAIFGSVGASASFPRVEPGDRPGQAILHGETALEITATAPGADRIAWFSAAGGTLRHQLGDVERKQERLSGGSEVLAPLAGRLLSIRDEPGLSVDQGEVVASIESMKMHWEVRAPAPGRLGEPAAAPGDSVEAGQLLLPLTD